MASNLMFINISRICIF